jgi:hypothetical protein
MSKIKFNKISEDQVEVFFTEDTPMELVQELQKSLISKGMIEDISNSTLSRRSFYKSKSKANDLADELIKSLKSLSKEESPSERRRKEMAESQGVKYESGKVVPNVTTSITGYRQIPANPNKSILPKMNTLVNKEEDIEEDQEDMDKSNYKGAGTSQYRESDNVRRKMSNTGEQKGFGPNVNVKRYTTAKYGDKSPQTDSKLKRPQPVKTFTPEQIAEENKKRGLIKAWADHLPFPNAEEEMARIAAAQKIQNGDDAMANQLANMMHSKAMLGGHRQPTSEDMIMAGEQMGLGSKEQVAKSQDQQWSGAINNWLAEATKPISNRFASEEEETAYWNSIRVSDSDSGESGY